MATPSTKKQKTDEKSATATKYSSVRPPPGRQNLLMSEIGCGDILFHAIFPFLSVNDQTNLCLASKSLLEARHDHICKNHASGEAMLVWEARDPTRRSYETGLVHLVDGQHENIVTVRQDQCFRFQLQTVEYGHLVVRIHLQNDLWDEQENSRTGADCRPRKTFPTQTRISKVDIFQPQSSSTGTSSDDIYYYRLFAMEVHTGQSFVMFRQQKEKKRGSPFHLLRGPVLKEIAKPDNMSKETGQILRSSFQYIWMCARRIECWSEDDFGKTTTSYNSHRMNMSYPTATYIMQKALPDALLPYCPLAVKESSGIRTADRFTIPAFLYRPAPSLETWQTSFDDLLGEDDHQAPRSWETEGESG